MFSSAQAAASRIERWAGPIAEASARFGIPQTWIRRVIAAESGGQTRLRGRPIESHAGAMGLMQLMPGTWRAMRAAHGLGPDPHDPRDNIMAGTAYLRLMYDRFGYPGLFAAYNAGPAAYAAYLAGSRRLPAETRAYVARVAAGAAPPARLGAAGLAARSAGPDRPQAPAPALFAIRAAGTQSGVETAARARASAPATIFFPLDGHGR
ncbi:MAG TPA: lytic transglycosylase domain-containing protein [Allosphingosinicella sp.]|nr:lytic transglycosylase domain-containing protein [Allosphingosinicella sp.]